MGCLFHSEFLEITFSIGVNCLLVMDFFFNAPRCPLSFSLGFAELCLKDRTINRVKPRLLPAIFILEIELFLCSFCLSCFCQLLMKPFLTSNTILFNCSNIKQHFSHDSSFTTMKQSHSESLDCYFDQNYDHTSSLGSMFSLAMESGQ